MNDETVSPAAPPVVATVVVHRPGAWFDTTLASLAAQDYPNLNHLFVVTGGRVDDEGVDIQSRIGDVLPDAFVLHVDGDPGFGGAANEVLGVVDGDSGFFCVCHDDVSLEPATIRTMVEELYRNNAGIVGPKIVEWDQPVVLQHVGLDVDRFGDVDERVEPGEFDQEQHDTVTEVFAVPSSCMLVRADLFRVLGGFDPAIDYHGDDVELCWRARLSGAHVIVAPTARVRHREELEVRRADLHHTTLRARHRARTFATLTAARRLPALIPGMVALAVVEFVIGLFTGRAGAAWASLRTTVGLLPRTPSILLRRRAVARHRVRDDATISGLQRRGSARLSAYRRSRETETYVGETSPVRRWRETSVSSIVAWAAVVVAILLASRTLINDRVPAIGELLPLPESPRELWSQFRSGWNPGGFGATSPNPTGWAVLSFGSVLWAFHGGLGLTMLVVGSILAGILGVWRLAAVFPSPRGRIAALVVYAALPLVPGVISTGRLSALIAYAVVPWFVQQLRLAVGIGTADPQADTFELAEAVVELAWRDRVRRIAVVILVAALGVAMAPGLILVFAAASVVVAAATLLSWAGWRTALWFVAAGAAGVAGAYVLNMPWSLSWTLADLGRYRLDGPSGASMVDVATMSIGDNTLGLLAISLYVPVVAGVVLARSWRLTWASRAAALVVAFLGLAVLGERGHWEWMPEVGILLAPVGVGLALSASAAVASFDADVKGRGFGWRQPLGLLAIMAVAVGAFPGVFAVTDGAWYAPRAGLAQQLSSQLLPVGATDSAGVPVSAYRTLYIGDPRVLPVPGRDLGAGVSVAVVDDGPLTVLDRWTAPESDLDDALDAALDRIATSSTRRGGRLLAPLGIRYIVVPRIDGMNSTASEPLPVPVGLVEALGSQLDIVVESNPPYYTVYENRAALPVVANLTGSTAAAVEATEASEIVAEQFASASGLPGRFTPLASLRFPVVDGVVAVAVAAGERWTLSNGADTIAPTTAFGVTMAFPVTAGDRPAELSYRDPPSRNLILFAVGLAWLVALVAASRARIPTFLRRRRRGEPVGEPTFIDLDADEAGPIDLDAPIEWHVEPAEVEPAEFGGWVSDLDDADREELAALGQPDEPSGPTRDDSDAYRYDEVPDASFDSLRDPTGPVRRVGRRERRHDQGPEERS